jgi:hypothetical protein
MISISCSNLERARKNHTLYAELLSDGDKLQRGGTFGMFAHWQETAKKLHSGELGLNNSLKHFHSSFDRFADTQRNRDKQSWLMEEFAVYARRHKLEKLDFHEPRHQIRWALTGQVQLTGLTPWVFKREDLYYAYFCHEKAVDWESELKYPLLQRYMANNIVHCRLNELYMGVYCLEKGKFEFRRYTPLEVKTAVDEASGLFINIYTEYSRLREGAGQ